MLKASRSNVRTSSRAGLFHAPVAGHALRLRQPRSGGGDRLKPELQTQTAPDCFIRPLQATLLPAGLRLSRAPAAPRFQFPTQFIIAASRALA